MMKLSKTEIVRVAGARNETMAKIQSLINQYMKMYHAHHTALGDAASAAEYMPLLQENGDVSDRPTYATAERLMQLKAGRDYRNFDQMLEVVRKVLSDHQALLAGLGQKSSPDAPAARLDIAAPHDMSSPQINGKPAITELKID